MPDRNTARFASSAMIGSLAMVQFACAVFLSTGYLRLLSEDDRRKEPMLVVANRLPQECVQRRYAARFSQAVYRPLTPLLHDPLRDAARIACTVPMQAGLRID